MKSFHKYPIRMPMPSKSSPYILVPMTKKQIELEEAAARRKPVAYYETRYPVTANRPGRSTPAR